MRIAYLCVDPGVPVFGRKGSSVHVQEMLRALRRLGHEPALYCARVGGEPPADLADVPVVERRIRGAAGAERERDTADAAAELALAAVADGCDLVYERYALFSEAAAVVARTADVPSVLEVNAPLVDEQARHRVLDDRAGAERATRVSLRAASTAVCVSEPVERWAREQGAPRTVVLPNGVDVERFAPAEHVSTDRPTVVFVGTLKPWHGVDRLLEAAAGLPLRLLVVGDGPEGAALREQAGRLGLDAEFTGAVEPAAIPSLLARADLAAAPYPGGEEDYFSPLKVFEYLAAGLPVVASATGQLPALLRDGVTGVLVPPGDVGALRAALAELAADPPARRRMGAAARAEAVREHDWRRVAQAALDAAAGASPHPLGVAS